jgi:hypothetical protein
MARTSKHNRIYRAIDSFSTNDKNGDSILIHEVTRLAEERSRRTRSLLEPRR